MPAADDGSRWRYGACRRVQTATCADDPGGPWRRHAALTRRLVAMHDHEDDTTRRGREALARSRRTDARPPDRMRGGRPIGRR